MLKQSTREKGLTESNEALSSSPRSLFPFRILSDYEQNMNLKKW